MLHELSLQQASLEEAFMQLTAESVEYHAGDVRVRRPARRRCAAATGGGSGSAVGRAVAQLRHRKKS